MSEAAMTERASAPSATAQPDGLARHSDQALRGCLHCDAPMATEILGPLTGASAPFVLTVHGLPVEVCANGHRQFVQSRAALQRLLRLGEAGEGTLPLSAQRGMFGRRVCPACNVALARRAPERETFHVEVRVGEAPPFGIDLTLPVSRCARCGRAHVRAGKALRGGVPAALVDALRAAGIGMA